MLDLSNIYVNLIGYVHVFEFCSNVVKQVARFMLPRRITVT